MSRKLVVASLAAAGVVAFGSAAVANVGLGADDLSDQVTGQTNLDDAVAGNVNGRDVAIPPREADLTKLLDQMRGELSSGGFTVQKGQAEEATTRLASSVQQLSDSIEQGNQRLPGGGVDPLERLSTGFDRAALGLRSAPSERVQDAVATNGELARRLTGLQTSLQRMQQLQSSDALEGQASNVLNADSVEDNLTEVVARTQHLMH